MLRTVQKKFPHVLPITWNWKTAKSKIAGYINDATDI